MIMKILTTMCSNHIIISILCPLVKLMTLSQLLETFELFNTVFDKEISISLTSPSAFPPEASPRCPRGALVALVWHCVPGCHFTAFQDHQSVIELTFVSCGQTDAFGEKEGADDCGLLRLHQCHIGIDLILEQMLAEQALGESPFRRKQVRSHPGANPTASIQCLFLISC